MKTSISRARKHIVNLFLILLRIPCNACVVAVFAACSEKFEDFFNERIIETHGKTTSFVPDYGSC